MITSKIGKARPSWLIRFWAVVRYEMLWNIRKKKFIGIVIFGFVLSIISVFLPSILSDIVDQPILANPNYVVTYSIPVFGLFLFALAISMNSISSEFETGTIVPLLTKPVSRTMVFLGKLFAAFIIILIAYTIFFVFIAAGGSIVYGAQNNLHLVPLGLIGNVITTFIWAAIILAIGALSKNTLISALVAFGLFMALFLAVPIVSAIAGPSTYLNAVPGSGASGVIDTVQGAVSIGAGTDNIGPNLVNWALYPSANANFTQLNIQFQGNTTSVGNPIFVYAEPTGLIAARSLGIGLVYIAVFLFIAWFALKKAQILE